MISDNLNIVHNIFWNYPKISELQYPAFPMTANHSYEESDFATMPGSTIMF